MDGRGGYFHEATPYTISDDGKVINDLIEILLACLQCLYIWNILSLMVIKKMWLSFSCFCVKFSLFICWR